MALRLIEWSLAIPAPRPATGSLQPKPIRDATFSKAKSCRVSAIRHGVIRFGTGRERIKSGPIISRSWRASRPVLNNCSSRYSMPESCAVSWRHHHRRQGFLDISRAAQLGKDICRYRPCRLPRQHASHRRGR